MADRLPPAVAARFERQVLLPRVGVAGQRRIMATDAAVAGEGFAHELAARYVERAGVRSVEPGAIVVDEAGPVEVTAAKEALAGSRAALAVIRTAVVEDA